MMRLTSEFWIAALLRRAFSDGGFAAIQKKGSSEAGAICIVDRKRDGTLAVYLPASQTSYYEATTTDRLFRLAKVAEDIEIADQLIAREVKFDPDIWVVEIETNVPIENYITIAAE